MSQPEAKTVIHSRLVGLSMVGSCTLEGEHTSFALGRNADEISPVRMDAKGPVLIADNQRCDGFLVRKKCPARLGKPAYIAQVLVGWANIRQVQFGEP